MDIFANPDESAVKQLLSESGLPIEDITAQHLQDFFGCGSGLELDGLVGLELYGEVALLRSLAVASSRRGSGVGSGLVAHAERHAWEQGVQSLYLLTTSAENSSCVAAIPGSRGMKHPQPSRAPRSFPAYAL
jgi:amino-acid N-acetyltransferase